MTSFCLSFLCIGRFNCRINYLVVPGSRNFHLFQKDYITYGTMLSIRQSAFCTGRRNTFINNFRVSLCRYGLSFLCSANRTCILDFSVLCTGRVCQNLSRIPAVLCQHRNHLLFFEDNTAYRAALSVCQSALSAGCRFARNSFFRVPGRGYRFCLGFLTSAACKSPHAVFSTRWLCCNNACVPVMP